MRLIEASARPVALARGLELATVPERHAASVVQRMAGRSRARDWFSLVYNEDTGSADLMIYDEIGYWGTTAKDFVTQLSRLDADIINLRLNSPGGEVYDGVAIYNALVEHPAHINVSIDGIAASIASVIAMSGDEIEIARTAEIMIHDAWGFTIGNAAEHEKAAADLHRISGNVATVYAERAGGDAADWRSRMLDETWYNADQAVEAGLADRVKTRGDSSAQDRRKAGRQNSAPEQTSEPFTLDVARLTDALKGAF